MSGRILLPSSSDCCCRYWLVSWFRWIQEYCLLVFFEILAEVTIDSATKCTPDCIHHWSVTVFGSIKRLAVVDHEFEIEFQIPDALIKLLLYSGLDDAEINRLLYHLMIHWHSFGINRLSKRPRVSIPGHWCNDFSQPDVKVIILVPVRHRSQNSHDARTLINLPKMCVWISAHFGTRRG